LIASLKGIIEEKKIKDHGAQIILDVHGVGYAVSVPLSLIHELSQDQNQFEDHQETKLYIHTHVREDAFTLYGFIRPLEKELFELLISVSGIGPKVAIGILSNLKPQELVKALIEKDIPVLKSLPGIGQKTANRLALELTEKVHKLGLELNFSKSTSDSSQRGAQSIQCGESFDALEALKELGYGTVVAQRALSAVQDKTSQSNIGASDLVRESLKELSNNNRKRDRNHV